MNNTGSDDHVMERWLASGKTARIAGLDLKPIPHPALATIPQCVTKGQASVYFLRHASFNNLWLLKKFATARRPTDRYLESVTRCLPGDIGFYTCTQRRLLKADYVDRRYSKFNDLEFARWIEGAILMPKVPGSSWASLADSLRTRELEWSLEKKLRISRNLAECVETLERGSCSHRDLSGGNVYMTPDGRVYLIDWDSLFHPDLPFQPNTTVGTMGYIAPFLQVTCGRSEASRSWCRYADRFALAILITEFLMVGPETPPAQEDGTLFSQRQLDQIGHEFIQDQLRILVRRVPRVTPLIRRAFLAPTFEDCPSPGEWRSVLRHEMRLCTLQQPSGQGRPLLYQVRHPCAACGREFPINPGKLNELQALGRPALCKTCLEANLLRRAEEKMDLDRQNPHVVCDHCRKTFRIAVAKLETLRSDGKPILCSPCLTHQMESWRQEQTERNNIWTQVTCDRCRVTYPIRKEVLAALFSRGKVPRCAACRNRQSHIPCIKPKPLFSKLLKLKSLFASIKGVKHVGKN